MILHESFMKKAIEEAKKGVDKTYTNPLVGAVIVNEGEIISTGAHLFYGQEHAEVNAINSCPPEKLFNSTLYVTLEPCTHMGKQPPCTEAILRSGIKKVVIGQLDPNPLVSGKGKRLLEQHGVTVIADILKKESEELNPFYNFLHKNKRPFVSLKQAMTLDGKLSLSGRRTSITGKEVYQFVREERKKYQAILVGSQTILIDNPLLTSMNTPFPPIRIVVDRRGRLKNQKNLRLFQDSSSPVWIFTEEVAPFSYPSHCEWIVQQNVTIDTVLTDLTKRNVHSLYVEGGATIHDAFIERGQWDELITYLSPKIIGGNGLPSLSSTREAIDVLELKNIELIKLGNDLRISGRR